MRAADEALVVAALRSPQAVEVRRRVVRQLVSSLIYEGAVPVVLDGGDHVVAGRDREGRPVEYRVGARRSVAFDRVRLADRPVSRVGADGARAEVASVAVLLDEIAPSILGGAHPVELARFVTELEETFLQDTLSQHLRRVRGDVLRDADHDALEGMVTDGHRYHPAYKSRIGFDLDDVAAYAPEFLPAVRPLWLAAHRSVVEVTTSALSPDPTRAELGDRWDPLLPQGHDPGEYVLLPVHPWQWRRVARQAFAGELAAGRLVVLGEDPAAFVPQQSIRTLACREEPARSQLKTALSITNTSTSRELAPHTVRNAAPISDWLAGLVEGDGFLRERAVVLREVHGVSVVPDVPAVARGRTEGRLGAIWRESLAPRVAAGERAVPVTALTATELDGTPVIAPWLATHGPVAWLEAHVDAVALPLVHLLVAHGVALESHAQNMSLIHVDGRPHRVVLRDFHDGVRFCRALLADPDGAPRLDAPPPHHTNANSFVETDDPGQVTDFLLDAFFFVNLGELGLFLDDHGLLDEETFWTVVARRVREHQERHGSGTFDLFTPTLEVEQLTTRRLAPDTELRTHTVSNPLHRFDPRRPEVGDRC